MDHQPFEDWLLENQPLIPRQKQQLEDHLQECTRCSALAEVNLALRAVRQASPSAGFTERFRVRLANHKQTLRLRIIIGFALLAWSVLAVLTVLAWPLLKALALSPADLFTTWASSLLSFWFSLQAVLRAALVLLRVVTAFVPSYVWAAVLALAGGWSLVWVASLIRFVKKSQGV